MKIPRLFVTLGLALCVLGFTHSSNAAINAGDTLFIDFGRTNPEDGIAMPANGTMNTAAGNNTGVADGNGNYWNNAWMNLAPGGGTTPPTVTNLITSANVGTGINLSFSAGWQANGFRNGGLQAPNSALLGDIAFKNATGDYYFLNAGDGPNTTTLTLSGLNPLLTYDFQIFATRETTEIRKTLYSITDVNGLHTFELQTSGPGIGAGGYNGNNNTFAIFTGIVPSEVGAITLSLHNTASNFAYIGTLQLTAVPEPATVGIVAGAGCLALIALRRRRRD